MPSAVAMANASLGLVLGETAALLEISAFGLMWVGHIHDHGLASAFLHIFFIEGRLRNHIFLGCPVPKIQQTAALAAKREVRVLFGVRCFPADRTLIRHGYNSLSLKALEDSAWRTR